MFNARVCQFRRVGKDLKDDWVDVMRLLDTVRAPPQSVDINPTRWP